MKSRPQNYNYIEEYKKAKRNGYVNSSTAKEEGVSSRGLQIRIAIDPDDLEKAVELLSPILKGENFKIMRFDDRNETTWDGVSSKVATDRDQRGKECCIYIDNDKDKTPEEWKELMLNCWSQLNNSNIRVGYVLPPHGDKAIEIKGGVPSPFSYTFNKPYQNRYGILHESDPNPNHFTDPLKDIFFSESELSKRGIVAQKMIERRLINSNAHQNRMHQLIFKEIQDISALVNNDGYEDVIEKFKEEVLAGKVPRKSILDHLPGNPKVRIESILEPPQKLIEDHKGNISRLISSMGRSIGTVSIKIVEGIKTIDELDEACTEISSRLKNHGDGDLLAEKLLNSSNNALEAISEYKNRLNLKLPDINNERENLKKDFLIFFKKNPTLNIVSIFHSSATINTATRLDEKIDKMIGADPIGMQKLYYKLIHMKHEEESLISYISLLKYSRENATFDSAMRNFCNPLIKEVLDHFSKSPADLVKCESFLHDTLLAIDIQEKVLSKALGQDRGKDYKKIFLNELRSKIRAEKDNQQTAMNKNTVANVGFFKKLTFSLSKTDKLNIIKKVAGSKEINDSAQLIKLNFKKNFR